MSHSLSSLRTGAAIVLLVLAACSDGTTSPAVIDPNTTTLDARADVQSADRNDARFDGRKADVLSNWQVRVATGKTIGEWGALWWKWAFANPQVLGDTDGSYSALGDVGGPVFFAEGSGGDPLNASVSVPGGQYVLLPVAIYIWTFFDPCAELACARRIVNRNFIDGISAITVTVDGERVRNLQSHIVRVDNSNPPFRIDVGPIDESGYGGILPAVQGGYWLMLEPLPRGKHTVAWSVTAPRIDGYTGAVVDGELHLDANLQLQTSRRRHDK